MSSAACFESTTRMLADALRNGSALNATEDDPDAVARIAAFHGVAGLVRAQGPLAEPIARLSRAEAMWDIEHVALVSGLLEALAEQAITPIVFKGEALAQTHYPSSEQRSRSDSDILIPHEKLADCRRVFAKLGFKRAPSLPSERVSGQENWTRTSPSSGLHAIDLHWRISNSPVLGNVFRFEDLIASSTPLPRLGPSARAPDAVHALLIACLHRKVHQGAPYYSETGCSVFAERLIWIYDVHLLATAFTVCEWRTMIKLAHSTDLARAVLEALQAANDAFGTTAPGYVLNALAASERGRIGQYLDATPSSRQRRDALASGGLIGVCDYLLAIAFPPRAYMCERYGLRDGAPLWLAYVCRILRQSMPTVLTTDQGQYAYGPADGQTLCALTAIEPSS